MKKKYETPLADEIAILSNVIMVEESIELGEDGDIEQYVGELLSNV